jgi:hypothetical protein
MRAWDWEDSQMRIFLDIETLPPAKDDPLISDRVAALSDEDFRKLALDGEYGRVLCIGVVIEHDGQIIHRGTLGRDRESRRFHLDEARTLRCFWKLIHDFNSQRDLFIGHNILDFDLHFLCQRSIIRRVKPSIEVCFKRYCSHPVYDVMWEFEHWKRRISLDELAKILGLKSSKENGINGSHVFDFFLEDRHEEIADYCMRDVELVRDIYYRMKFLE